MSLFLKRETFPALLDMLASAGFDCIGPQVRQGAIVFDRLEKVEQLPAGWQDEQQTASYRLHQTGSPYWFDWANGASAIKPYAFTPQESLWKVSRDASGRLSFHSLPPTARKTAIIGVRACDLVALAIQDQHFLYGKFADPYYKARRDNLLLIGVNCTHAAATCFCVSTGDGPEIHDGYDLLLSEIDEGFIVASRTIQGEQIAGQLPLTAASDAQLSLARQRMQVACDQQRSLPTRLSLYDRPNHPHWQEIGARCLACGNCTSVCPTCFCHQEVEQPSLDGNTSTHDRRWDTCFQPGHSYIHGWQVRSNATEYYRQWLSHKLDGWHEQFQRSGCTGCGRCITWCPAGIDLTEEVKALASTPLSEQLEPCV